MTQRAGSLEPRDVAVGATREEAAGTFGEYFDDAFFTSYDDFDAEVDLALLRSLGLVAGDGLTEVLPRVLTRHNEPGGSPQHVLVGLPPDVDRRGVVEEVLASHPSVTFTRVLESGDGVLVPLVPVGESRPGAHDSLLDTLPVAPLRRAPEGTAAHTPHKPPRGSPSSTAADSHGTAPPARWGRRQLLLVAAAGAFVMLLLLTAVGVVAGADVVLLVAVLFLAASQFAILLGLLYVARVVRELRHDREDAAAFRELMRDRTTHLVRLSKESSRRSEVAGVRNRVMSIGKLLSRERAALRQDAEAKSVRKVDDTGP